MRIKKFFLQYKTFKPLKIFIIFFSILFNIFTPVLAKMNSKLKSGGQLFQALRKTQGAAGPESQKFLFDQKNKNLEGLQTKANTDATIKEKKNPEPVKKVETKPETEISEKKKEPKTEFKEKTKAPQELAQEKAREAREKEKELEKKDEIQSEEKIVFNFEDVDLSNVAAYVEKLFDVKFLTDEVISPMPKGGKALSGNKISFKTQKSLTKKQAWNLFLAFLNMVGLTIVPQGLFDDFQDKAFDLSGKPFTKYEIVALQDQVKIYRVMAIQGKGDQTGAQRSAIPSYIGVDPEVLPDSDIVIRYGYFVKDCPLETIKQVIESLKSTFANLLILNDHNAFILTDGAHNIKVLMKIVKELDRVTMPQSMSVLRLYKTDAKKVVEVYKKLTQDDQQGAVASRIFGHRKPSRALYFSKNTKMIEEPRTNSLVLLGTAEGIKKVEDFVKKYLDVDVTAPYSPLNIYELKYANANDIAAIMSNLIKAGDPKQRGGIRGGDQYFKNMSFTAEPEGNRLIIRGDYDDYLKVKDIIAELDEPPAQVAIEILLLGVEVQDQKELGAQIRNKFKTPDGQRINFQTSGITLGGTANQVVLNKDTDAKGNLRLLGDLVSLVTGAVSGNTVVSLGSDKYGVWGVFGMLNKIANTQVLSNPFLTATNNTKAKVKLGETVRIVTAEVKGASESNAFGDYEAAIVVEVTPKINSDGMIVTDLKITFNTFLQADNPAQTTRELNTSVILSNNEVLALGGLLKDQDTDAYSKTPILGSIPILGWFFKNKAKTKRKQDLLVLLTASIVKPDEKVTDFTKRHLKEYKETLTEFNVVKNKKDPVDRAFFKDSKSEFELDHYLFTRGKDYPVKMANNTQTSKKLNKREKRRRGRSGRSSRKARRKKRREKCEPVQKRDKKVDKPEPEMVVT